MHVHAMLTFLLRSHTVHLQLQKFVNLDVMSCHVF